jgi:hypothetical protein
MRICACQCSRIGLGKLFETRQPFGVTGERFGQNFADYITSELRIAGTVDFAHPARTNS